MNKRTHLLPILILALVLGTFYSCEKDALVSDDPANAELNFRAQQNFRTCTGQADIFQWPEEGSVDGPFTNSLGTVYGYPTQVVTFDFFNPDLCPDFDDNDLVIPETNQNVNKLSEPYTSLVNQHRSKNDCANADPRGGSIVFEFEYFSRVNSFVVWDTEETGYVTFYGANDEFLSFQALPIQGDGEFCQVQISSPNDPAEVAKMVVDFGGSGAISDLCITVDAPGQGIDPTPVPPSEFDGCTRDWKYWRDNKDQTEDPSCPNIFETTLCEMTFAEILDMQPKGRDAILLLKEVVAEELNTICLGAPFSLVAEAYSKAVTELACNPIPSEDKWALLVLRHFNQGLIGPGACE